MANSKIFIHAVYNENDVFVCRHPQCNFSGPLSEVAAHTVANQFIVKQEKKQRPADLFKI